MEASRVSPTPDILDTHVASDPPPSLENLGEEMVGRGNTWNTKCPIFLGNFTPKTATIALKIGHLAFQAHIYGDLTWGIYMPKKQWENRLSVR